MSTKELAGDPKVLSKLTETKMPFGKYANRYLMDLPQNYLVWFSQKGFPKGELGMLMTLTLEIKMNGLEYLLKPLSHK
ncbi:DUF3820 family protein [Deltaproteobacteria bacterium TL4]